MKTLSTLSALALSAICSASAATIVFEDQFANLSNWTTNGQVAAVSGDYFGAPIDTSGTSDHSDIHFDAEGNEITAVGQGFIAFNGAQAATDPANTISTDIAVLANNTYTVYFRHAAYTNGAQIITGTFSLGGDSSTTGPIAAVTSYDSESFSFTPTSSGLATLQFSDAGSNSFNSDLFLDSVVVAVPEPSSSALLGLAGLALMLRRRK